ncbi:hypothetical protein NX773_13505 [Massilia solisilvae]|uniref:DUF4412 domain-containing protein n=1 Tax=Massilia solisilvae TaxID=1811225 RepID=A0ABT2BMT3_9BURK|nr:hypothetical protein [Massilia solisilvae]MCS0609183.1 hypothetical protein [Massilia solisilvae]
MHFQRQISLRHTPPASIALFAGLLQIALLWAAPPPARAQSVNAKPATPARATADAMWVGSVGHWGSFGIIEMRANGKVSRLTRYSNGDYLAEIATAGKLQRMLMAGPQLAPLYFGLSGQELEFSRNPFFMFLEGAAIPLFALHMAFPAGPASLLPAPSERLVRIGPDGVAVSAWKALEAGVIEYRMDGDAQTPKVAGRIGMTRPEPLTRREIDSWGPPQQAMPPQPMARP